MTRIPAPALLLAIAGLAPFIIGAVLASGILPASTGAATNGSQTLVSGMNGNLLMTRYGVIILCFMAGALGGVATKTEGTNAAICYVLSALPALWAFLNPGTTADEALINLMIGFIAVLLIDYAFYRWELTPRWWMSLRIPVTLVVVICLAVRLMT